MPFLFVWTAILVWARRHRQWPFAPIEVEERYLRAGAGPDQPTRAGGG
jgi:hypothetical protein